LSSSIELVEMCLSRRGGVRCLDYVLGKLELRSTRTEWGWRVFGLAA